MDKYLIVIMGPTAVGKTEVAINIAKEFQTEIISADSRQFYKEMNIGTAKPSNEQLKEVKHHLINSLNSTDNYNAGTFETDALKVLETIYKNKDIAVMVGGSGLYINAVFNGIDEMPETNTETRAALSDKYSKEGLQSLVDELKQVDRVYYEKVDKANPHRIIRALEVFRNTGLPYSAFLNREKKHRSFKVIKIGLDMDRKELYKRINNRVDVMIEKGLEKEVNSLSDFKKCNSMQTVGYSEWFDYFDENISIDRVIELIKQNSRRYAKRQMTWFRKDKDIKWFLPEKQEEIVKYVMEEIK